MATIVGGRNPAASAIWNDYLFAPGIDEPLALSTGQGTAPTYFGVDGLGSVVIMTDASASILGAARYSPWGEGGAFVLFGYTGREQGDGLWHYRAREYRAAIGRFISEDPIGLRGGSLNFYVYVGNEPTFGTDPLGTEPKWPKFPKPVTADCGPEDWKYCEGKCAPQPVLGCYVTWFHKLKTTKGFPQFKLWKIVNCNCKEGKEGNSCEKSWPDKLTDWWKGLGQNSPGRPPFVPFIPPVTPPRVPVRGIPGLPPFFVNPCFLGNYSGCGNPWSA